MIKIKITDIKIDKSDTSTRRVRKSLGNVTKLAASIKARGLMHPIVVSPLDNDERYKWKLIAGERRIRAYILNSDTSIDCTIFENMDEISQKMCELEENIVRENFDWMEECEALRQLDELKRLKHGTAQPGGTTGWKLEDTAEVVGMSRSIVAEDIKLSKDLLNNPGLIKKVRKLPKTAAKKIVRQEIEAGILRRQVANNELAISSNLILGDACELIDKLDDDSVNLLITDPPFGIEDIIKVGKMGSMTYNEIVKTNVSDREVMKKVYRILIPKLFKKLVAGAHVYIFFGHGWYCELICMLRDAGFVIDDLPLIWHKKRPSMIAKDMHYTSSYEAILFGYKPPIIRILKKPIANVLAISAVAPQKRAHPLQKPFELLKIFIQNSSYVGELVLDCFAGSASTLIACDKLKRSSIGYEIDETNYLRAQKFMSESLEGDKR